MLNSFPKYATRDLPGLKTYLKRKGHLPEGLVLGLAAIMVYYRGGKRADGADIVPNDAPEIMELLSSFGKRAMWRTLSRQCWHRPLSGARISTLSLD